MGISAFFWLPLIVERAYLSDFGYKIASEQFLPENVWRWKNFLDTHFFFQYVPNIPFKLGIVQLALALAGIVLARRRDLEWIYLIVATVVAGLLIGAWALPIWQSSRILVTVQFAWRLLIIMSLPLALFTGAIVLRLRRPSYKLALGSAVAVLLIVANRPQLAEPTRLTLGIQTYLCPGYHSLSTRPAHWALDTLREFQPRWTTGNEYQPTEELPPGRGHGYDQRANSLGYGGQRFQPERANRSALLPSTFQAGECFWTASRNRLIRPPTWGC